jgi:hypothetical protein
MMFNYKEDEKMTGGKRGFAHDKIYKNDKWKGRGKALGTIHGASIISAPQVS